MDKTTQIDVNGTTVLVDSLPKNIRDLIAMFDKMRSESEDVVYRHNVLRIAIGTLNANIVNEAQTYLDELNSSTSDTGLEVEGE